MGRGEAKEKKRTDSQAIVKCCRVYCIGAFLLTGVFVVYSLFSEEIPKISFSYQHYITFTTILMTPSAIRNFPNVTFGYREDWKKR